MLPQPPPLPSPASSPELRSCCSLCRRSLVHNPPAAHPTPSKPPPFDPNRCNTIAVAALSLYLTPATRNAAPLLVSVAAHRVVSPLPSTLPLLTALPPSSRAVPDRPSPAPRRSKGEKRQNR
ncbi:hypothetical protein ACJRO7_024314, partial [Eucalyptus globulus]